MTEGCAPYCGGMGALGAYVGFVCCAGILISLLSSF